MNADATVLKLYPLGENGLIVVWCSGEGIIRTAAKGARKQSSPLPDGWISFTSAVCSGRRRKRATCIR